MQNDKNKEKAFAFNNLIATFEKPHQNYDIKTLNN